MLGKDFFKRAYSMTAPSDGSAQDIKRVIKTGVVFGIKYTLWAMVVVAVFLVSAKLLCSDIHNKLSTEEFKAGIARKSMIGFSMICLAGPLIEEMLFRLWLSFKRHHICISAFLITYTALSLFILPHSHNDRLFGVQSVYFEHIFLKLAICAVITAVCYMMCTKYENHWQGRRHLIIMLSLLAFSLIHLTNIVCPWYVYPFAVVLCMPQLVLGTSVTYFRLRLGFFAGFLFHCAVNTIGFFISFGKLF